MQNVIDDIELARALHVVFVVHWIGGVAFVTLVALPLARASRDASAGWALFEAIENRFVSQARWSIPLAGAAGFWMVWRLDLWSVLADGLMWWLDAMTGLWALFMAAVFIVEPLAHGRIAEWLRAIPRLCCEGSGACISRCLRRRASRSSAPSPAPTVGCLDD